MDSMIVVFKSLGAIIFGVIQGNAAVYLFNKTPGAWLCEYGVKPKEELLHPKEQRIKSYPWKWIFSMLFIVINIRLSSGDLRWAVAVTLILWLLLFISISDVLYKIIPDQIVIVIAVSAVGFIPFWSHYLTGFIGGIIGLALMLMPEIIGRITLGQSVIGGGDIKLMTALGLCFGPVGIISIFITSYILSGLHIVYLLVRRKIKRKDYVAMAPYIALSTAVYALFSWKFISAVFVI